MATKIKSLIIVNLQGTHTYFVGQEYNGLLLAKILNKSLEYPDSMHTIYNGYTANDDLVFEAMNVPTDVQYCGA